MPLRQLLWSKRFVWPALVVGCSVLSVVLYLGYVVTFKRARSTLCGSFVQGTSSYCVTRGFILTGSVFAGTFTLSMGPFNGRLSGTTDISTLTNSISTTFKFL